MNYKLFGFFRLIKNIFFPRKGMQVSFCLSMINALSAYLDYDQVRFEREVSISTKKLNSLMKLGPAYEDPIKQWIFLRKLYNCLNSVII